MKEKREYPDWGMLFKSILDQPGRLADYYSLFHRYSLGNQALAIGQLCSMGVQIGPISSFNGWKKLGRKVKKGAKAIGLWMPVVKKQVVLKDDGTQEEKVSRFFIMKNNWFALSQTEPIDPNGAGMTVVPETPKWDKVRALNGLGIKEVPFSEVNGNAQGFARPTHGEIAINPLAAMPWKTLFHEIAHCLLHSKEAQMVDGGEANYAIEEAEAEAVAFLCCATLGLPGLDESRGYIQNWLGSEKQTEEFAKKSAARVFSAADKILKAGSDVAKEEGEAEANACTTGDSA